MLFGMPTIFYWKFYDNRKVFKQPGFKFEKKKKKEKCEQRGSAQFYPKFIFTASIIKVYWLHITKILKQFFLLEKVA